MNLLLGLVTAFAYYLEIVTFSRQGQIIANYQNVRYIASIDNKSTINTKSHKIKFNVKCYTFCWQQAQHNPARCWNKIFLIHLLDAHQ